MAKKSVFKPTALKAKTNRNPFSLAHTNVFHAPYGALLPVATFKVAANSYFEMNMENQTIMSPVVRPAFALLKEHFDVFAVPMVQLHQAFDNLITGISNYDSSAIAYANRDGENPYQVPMFDGSMLADSLFYAYQVGTDEFGINKAYGMCRILDLLGYGNYYKVAPDLDAGDISTSGTPTYELIRNTLPQNFYNLLAYQKIYYSAYSNKKYEEVSTLAFNIDDCIGQVNSSNDWTTQRTLAAYGAINRDRFIQMSTMRYRWADKDYFTCVEPYVLPDNQQFGYIAKQDGAAISNIWQLFGVPGTTSSTTYGQPSIVTQTSSGNPVQSNGQTVIPAAAGTFSSNSVNVASIRFAFAYDRLLRRMRSAGPTFNLQMLAQFGIHPIDERHGEVKRLGGWTNQLRMSEVVSTSESTNIDLGTIGGKMTSYSNNSKKIKYHAKEDCIIMVIYSTSVKNQYHSFRYKRDNLCRYRFDWFNPAFENLGLQPLFYGEYTYIPGQLQITSTDLAKSRDTLATSKSIMGYVKRYLEYKTHPNEIHGLFQFPYQSELESWVTQFRDLWYAGGDLQTIGQTALAQPTLECSPFSLNGILQVAQDGSWETDAFLVFSYFDAKVIANMSIDGEDF